MSEPDELPRIPDVSGESAAVDALLALHVKRFDGYIYEEVCDHCSDADGRSWALWPCATVQALTAADS